MSNQEIDPSIQLFVKNEIDGSRTKTLGWIGTIATVLAILTGFGVYGLATQHTNELIREGVLSDIEEEAQSALSRAQSAASSAASHAEQSEIAKKKILGIKGRYEAQLEKIATLETEVKKLKKQLADTSKLAIRKNDKIHLEASNAPGQFVRHYNNALRIGGERNQPYEGDRTWILRKKVE